MNIEIVNTEAFDEGACISNLHTATHVIALDGYTVRFEVLVTNDEGVSHPFLVCFETEERSDHLKAYTGYEMREARFYGCDADESRQLEKFLDYDDAALCDLRERAEDMARQVLHTFIGRSS